MRISCNIPHSSVLGPLQWNVLYDEVLNMDAMKGAVADAYTEDLGIVAIAKIKVELMKRPSSRKKTETVLLVGRRRIEPQ